MFIKSFEGDLTPFAKEPASQLIHFVPRDNIVQRTEIKKKTVIDFDPTASLSEEYRKLTRTCQGDRRNPAVCNP